MGLLDRPAAALTGALSWLGRQGTRAVAISILLGVAGAVLGGIGSMFSGPIMIIVLAMMYYDLRIRKEAFDLQLMLEALDAPPGS